jgi:hypothetical protein
MAARKPRIFKGPAAQYAGFGESIYEFTIPGGFGGLISLRTRGDGTPTVDIYNVSTGVAIHPPVPASAKYELQQQVNKAFEEPDYVDTGDLIAALDQALSLLNRFGVLITKPGHDEEL